MTKLSNRLRSVRGLNGDAGIAHWCPGCDSPHVIWTSTTSGGPQWFWDGNVEAPTCSPSIRCFTTLDEDDLKPLPPGQTRTLCHYFLRGGKLEFCGDSPHALSGKTVPLPAWPEDAGVSDADGH